MSTDSITTGTTAFSGDADRHTLEQQENLGVHRDSSASSQVVNSTAQASTAFLTLNPRPKPWLTSKATGVCFKG
jgi:hypothetical protein